MAARWEHDAGGRVRTLPCPAAAGEVCGHGDQAWPRPRQRATHRAGDRAPRPRVRRHPQPPSRHWPGAGSGPQRVPGVLPRTRRRGHRVEHADRGGHGLSGRLHHQDVHRDRRDAALGAGVGRPRRASQRLLARLPAGPREAGLPAGDNAPPADSHRRDSRGGQSLRPAPSRLGPVRWPPRPPQREGRRANAGTRRVLPRRPPAGGRARYRLSPTAITGSPRSARSSRT
jgi:hypothetical protein